MKEPRWLDVRLIKAIHAESAAQFGGAAEIRDLGLLESALERPRSHFAYGDQPTLFVLAAMYCAAIVRNHPFVDGNKRTGLIAAATFLALNGYRLEPPETDAANMIISLAAGEVDAETLATWIAEHATPLR